MVTDADREAAADLAHRIYGQRIADFIRRGEWDDHHLAKALDAHREATVAEIVAWLRGQSDDGLDRALRQKAGTPAWTGFGGGSLALKRAADALESGEWRG